MEHQGDLKKIDVVKDNILYLILMSTVPLFIVQITGVIASVFLSNYQSNVTDIFIIWTTMILGLCLVPYYILKKIYSPKLSDLGVKKVTFKEVIFFCIALISLYLFSKEKNIYLLMNISLQTLGVALTEEFWARGILCYMLEKISDKKWLIIIVNSLIFTFITHMNRPFFDNLIFRLPGSLCMVIVYMKNKNLNHSISLHFIYNMIGYFY